MRQLAAVFLVGIILFLATTKVTSPPQSSERLVVVIDSYHDPVLSNFTIAIESLNESLEGCVDMYYNNDTLNSSTLSGVSIFIVPPFNKTFTDSEQEIIRKYVSRGGILVLMALDYDSNRGFNANPVLFNDLLSAIPLKSHPRLNYTIGGIGLRYIDPLSNDSFLHINSSQHFTQALKTEYLHNKKYNLIVEPTVITVEVEDINDIPAIVPPAWTYCISGNGTVIYFESGATIFVLERYGQGYVVVCGFAISLSDLENPLYGHPWIELGDNKKFWTDLLTSLIRLPEEANNVINPSYIAILLGGLGIIFIATAVIISRREKPAKKKEISISEVLRKMRKKK